MLFFNACAGVRGMQASLNFMGECKQWIRKRIRIKDKPHIPYIDASDPELRVPLHCIALHCITLTQCTYTHTKKTNRKTMLYIVWSGVEQWKRRVVRIERESTIIKKVWCRYGKMHLKWKISIVYRIYGAHELKFISFRCLTKTTTAMTTVQNENNDFQPFMSLYNIVIEHGAFPHFSFFFFLSATLCIVLANWLFANCFLFNKANITHTHTHKLKNSFHIHIVFALNCWNQTFKLSN